jgi:lipid II:glycine glycyltransferase (peptidoglycan interpeptide bridge formation enzyme)
MKYIQVIDGAVNSVYDIFAATDEEFSLVFPEGTDIAFIDEVIANANTNGNEEMLNAAFRKIWRRRVKKSEAHGIHGILFYELEEKKIYYPTRRDEEAINPNGTLLR